jgi:hypothetical protein
MKLFYYQKRKHELNLWKGIKLAALYYQGQPPFDELIKRIALHIHEL